MTQAPSPDVLRSGQVTFTIQVDGREIEDTVQVVSIDTWIEVNRLARARLILFDGSAASRDFELSNAPTFLPGKEVRISAGYFGDKETVVFKGVIVEQGLEIDDCRASRLRVNIIDPAIEMTLERKNAFFEKVTDSDLIGKLITANGLKKQVEATKEVHSEIVQFYATDWDLMLLRAEMNGMVVITDGGTVRVARPDTGQQPALLLEYGDSILELRAEMDAASQFASSAIQSHTWDIGSQKVVQSGPGRVNVEELGNVSSADLAKVFDVRSFTQQTGGTISKDSLQAWSSAELLRSKLSKIRGEVCFQGSSKVLAGGTLELAGLGQRFNGKAWVSGVHHSITDGRWITTAAFGLTPRWFAAEAPAIAAPDASGQLPPIKGLQTGIVKKVAKDPDGEYRVFVELPLLQENSKGVWARLGTFYASKKVGAVFFPEVQDEVIVGFMNQDPRYAVILGAVYSKKLPPPYPPDEKNDKKAIVTRSKLEITFDDKDKVMVLKTPGGHSVSLDDKSGKVTIEDSNRNRITLSKGGLELDSAANVTIKAKRDVSIEAGGNLDLSAKMKASMAGMQVSHKAKTKFSAQGNTAAEVKASGILTVRGAMVKIN